MRASNRAEADPAGDAHGTAWLPGAPFHSFSRGDAAPLRPGVPARVRFELLPTAYCFAPVCHPAALRAGAALFCSHTCHMHGPCQAICRLDQPVTDRSLLAYMPIPGCMRTTLWCARGMMQSPHDVAWYQ